MSLEVPGIMNTGVPPDIIVKDRQKPKPRQKPAPVIKVKTKKSDSENLQQALDQLERTFSIFNKRLKFYVNREIGRVVVKVIDSTTDKVIKEIPPEEIQRLIARIKEAIGMVIDEKR